MMKFGFLLVLIKCTIAITLSEFNTLKEIAEITLISYCLKYGLKVGNISDSCGLDICQSSGIEVIETFDFGDFKEVGSGFLGLDNVQKRILLIFRGTASTRDWINNLEAVPIPYLPLHLNDCSGCRIHKGFYNFLKQKSAKLIYNTHLLKLQYPNYKLLVAGHSLGGALSVLAAIELQIMGDEPLIVTFGAPKIGNWIFSEWVDNLFHQENTIVDITKTGRITNGYIRVTHSGDPVPKLPPPPIYKHSGVHYNINKRRGHILDQDVEFYKPGYDALENEMLDERFKRIRDAQLENKRSDDEDNSTVDTSNVLKLWPEEVGKHEHKHYFIKMGCQGQS